MDHCLPLLPSSSFQERSWSTSEVQPKSRGSGDVQAKSRGSGAVQPKSLGTGDVQAKSRSAQLKSTEFYPRILLPLNQNSPVPNSPRNDEFLRQVAHRLFNEQFYAFLDNIEELNDGKQPLEETLRKAYEIFGTDNRDLYLTFEELVKSYQISYQHPWSSPITVQKNEMKFFPQAKICLFYKDLFISFQGWLISSQEFSAASSPPHKTSDFIRLAWSHEFIRIALSRLSKEQLDAMFVNAMELASGNQRGEETLLNLEEIFGIVNNDLLLSFQKLLSPNIL